MAILSCARCRDAPESLNDFEMPAALSSTVEIALAAVYWALSVSFWVRKSLTRFCRASRVVVSFCLLLVELLVLRLHLVDLLLGRRLAGQGLLGQVLAVGLQRLLGLVLEVVDGVLELLLLELEPLLGRGEVDQGPAHLGDLLEHLLVGEVEHLVGLLGRVERLVRLGLHDVVRPLEDAHVCLPGVGPSPHDRFNVARASRRSPLVALRPATGHGSPVPGSGSRCAMIGPLRCVPDMSPSLGASPKG